MEKYQNPLEDNEENAKKFQQEFYNFDLTQKILALSENKNNQNRKPKLPKGTRDFHAYSMAIRAKAF